MLPYVRSRSAHYVPHLREVTGALCSSFAHTCLSLKSASGACRHLQHRLAQDLECTGSSNQASVTLAPEQIQRVRWRSSLRLTFPSEPQADFVARWLTKCLKSTRPETLQCKPRLCAIKSLARRLRICLPVLVAARVAGAQGVCRTRDL